MICYDKRTASGEKEMHALHIFLIRSGRCREKPFENRAGYDRSCIIQTCRKGRVLGALGLGILTYGEVLRLI